MAEKIALNIDVNAGDSPKTLGDLEQRLEGLNEQLRETEIGTKAFKDLQTAIAQTGREVKNLELSMEALDNEQVASELGSVAGAVGDVTASFILLGGESETMEEIGKNIETAIGLSMGLKGAIEGISSAQKLYNGLIKNHSIVQKISNLATKNFSKALIGTGIGAIVVGIGMLIANLESVGNWFKWVAEQIYQYFKPPIDLVISALEYLGWIESKESKERKARLESDTKTINKEYESRLKILNDSAKKEKEIANEKVEAMDFEIRKRKANGEDTAKIEKQKLEFLILSAQREIEIEQQKVNLLQESIKKQLALRGITMEQAKQFASTNEAMLKQFGIGKNMIDALYGTSDELEASKDNLTKLQQDLEVFNLEQGTKARERAKKEFEAREDIDKAKIIKAKQIADEEVKIEEEKYNWISMLAQQESERLAKEQAERLRAIEYENEKRQEQIDKVQAGLDFLNAGADLFIKDEQKREKIKKKLAVAQLGIDTARAISSGIASAMAVPFPANIPAVLSTLAVIMGNMAQARNLLGSSSSGSASLGSAGARSSGAGGGVPISPVSNTSTILGDQKVVVAEGDITQTQKTVSVAENVATYG